MFFPPVQDYTNVELSANVTLRDGLTIRGYFVFISNMSGSDQMVNLLHATDQTTPYTQFAVANGTTFTAWFPLIFDRGLYIPAVSPGVHFTLLHAAPPS